MLESFVAEDGGSFAVYLPYCSLHQRGLDGEERSLQEAKLYTAALGGLAALYSHGAIPILMLAGLPKEIDPTGRVCKAFNSSAWTHFELSASRLVKPPGLLLDLSKFVDSATTADVSESVAGEAAGGAAGEAAGSGAVGTEAPFLDDVLARCKATRPPPELPVDFHARLEFKAFGMPKCDIATAERLHGLYSVLFNQTFPGQVRTQLKPCRIQRLSRGVRALQR